MVSPRLFIVAYRRGFGHCRYLALRRAEGLPLSKVVYVKRPEAMEPPQCVWDHVAVFAGVSPNRLVTIDTAEILEARRL